MLEVLHSEGGIAGISESREDQPLMNFRCGAWEQKDRMGLESFSSEAAWKGGGSYDVSHFRHSFGNFPPNSEEKGVNLILLCQMPM